MTGRHAPCSTARVRVWALAVAVGLVAGCGCPGAGEGPPHVTHTDVSPHASPDPRYEPLVPTYWPATLAWDRAPVDLSWLAEGDRPAGRHGRVQAVGDALQFADGTPARFWGTNLSADALFSGTPEAVRGQAKRLAAFGFNLVRIHHQDSGWVQPNVFGREAPSTLVLDPESMARIDWWVHCLQQEGIYVWLDLHVGREFSAADGITDYAELVASEQPRQAKGFAFVNPSIQARMADHAAAYLDHGNPHTGRRYRDDPAVVAVLVTNENDLTVHFGRRVLDAPRHRARYEAAAEGFARDHGGAASDYLQPWALGPGKMFAAELEAGLFTSAISRLRGDGYPGLVATSSVWGGGAYVLPSLAVGDVVDVHAYGEGEALSSDPRTTPHFLSWAAGAQVAGKPATMTEWNIPIPAWDRFVGPAWVAAMASLQGWDAPMMFAYLSHEPAPPTRMLAQYSSFADPATMAMMPLAALAYRRGDIAPARQTYVFDLDADGLFSAELSAGTSAALRTLAERSRVVVALPDVPALSWDRAYAEPGATVVTEPSQIVVPLHGDAIVSDTGEIRRDFGAGVLTVDTPRTQVAEGWIGGRELDLSSLRTRIRTAKAAVGIVALDDAPLPRAREILLTVVARAHPPDPVASAPLRAEPVRGTVWVRSDHAHLRVQPRLVGPDAPDDVPSTITVATDGWHPITLPDLPTHWYVLTPADEPAPTLE